MELLSSTAAFWPDTGAVFRSENPVDGGNARGRVGEALRKRITWVTSLFLFIYMGIEVGVGGWIVTFMLDIRHGTPFASGMVATGFWLGITLGRLALGFVTPLLGENFAVALYLSLCLVFTLLYSFIPSFLVSAITVSLLGFFLGPMFPAAVVATTKLLDQRLHVTSITFAAAVAGAGACVFPFAVGSIAKREGVGLLKWFVIAMNGVLLLVWLIGVPPIDREGGADGRRKGIRRGWTWMRMREKGKGEG